MKRAFYTWIDARRFFVAAGACGLFACSLSACASHAPPAHDATIEARRIRAAQGMDEAKKAAPQLFAQADEEISRAQSASADGDDTGASLHGETAEALFYRARVQARRSRAEADRDDAERALKAASDQRDAYAKTRAELARAGEQLDVELRIAREKAFPAASGPTTPEREQARKTAARSLLEEARLLCTAAQLVLGGKNGDELTRAQTELTATETELANGSKTDIMDRAGRARVRCLSALEHARDDDAAASTKNDALLANLSSAGFSPSRAEQGVIVTLSAPFAGPKLAEAAQKKLVDLGRVAKQEASGVVIVVHDAEEPHGEEADRAHGNLAADALAQGGVDRAQLKIELAGNKMPLFDPKDAARRAKNARVDVIFVR